MIQKAQRNCLIIHGCPSDEEKAMNPETRTFDKHWIPYVKAELNMRNVLTKAPTMPSPWSPDYTKFKWELAKYPINENTILIGHSCGCAFLVRYLGETKKKIAKLILVAPWKITDEKNIIKEAFYNYEIDASIKDRVKEIIMFTSDNEEEDGKKSLKLFHDALGGEIININGYGHYVLGHMKTEKFPELVKLVLR